MRKNSYHQWYIFFIVLTFILVNINIVSAFEFDNIKEYDAESKTMTVKNSLFGISTSTVGNVTLLENGCESATICYAIIEINLNEKRNKLIDSIRFNSFDGVSWKNGNVANYTIYIKDGEITKTVDTFDKKCVKDLSNMSNLLCEDIKIGTKEIQENNWISLNNTNTQYSTGKYILKLKVKKGLFERVDWIGSFFSIEADEWAVFDNNMIAYYTFEEGSGTIVNNVNNLSIHNFTRFVGNPTWVTQSKLGSYAMNYTNGNHTGNTTINTTQIGMTRFSISFWINITGTNSSEQTISSHVDGGFARRDIRVLGGLIRASVGNSGDEEFVETTGVRNGTWYFVVVTAENNGLLRIYLNGSNTGNASLVGDTMNNHQPPFRLGSASDVGTASLNATLDDFAYWNVTLTPQEVNELWNSGNGLMAPNLGLPISSSVTLTAPLNNTNTLNSSLTFNSTVVVTNGRLTNSTLFLWYSNGSEYKRNTTTVNGTGTNTSSLAISGINILNNFRWNYQYCAVNSTATICNVSISNFTFNNDPIIRAEQFNNGTSSFANELFILNISTISGLSSASATLYYNNTAYTTTSTQNGENYSFSRSITIPSVSSQTTKNFNWSITLIDSQNTRLYNTTSRTQTIDTISLDNCTTNTQLIFNFSLRDEESQLFLTPAVASLNTTIEVELDLSNIQSITDKITFNMSFNNTNPARICINTASLNQSQQYRVDSLIKYFSTSRVKEFYNIQNFTLSNSTIPQNIQLYDLLTVDSQEFLITFKDENFIPVEDGLISVTRKYIPESLFKTVEIPKTDVDGQTLAHLVLSDIIYTFIVSKNGRNLGTFNDVVAICQDLSVGKCTINLNSLSSTVNQENFLNYKNLRYSNSFNETSRVISTLFNTIDGSTTTIQLNVSIFDNRLNTSICSNTLSTSSGTISCTIAQTYGNISIQTSLFSNGELVSRSYYQILQDAKDIFGNTGIILTIMLYLTLPLMFISNPVVVVIGSMIALIMAGLLNLYTSGSIFGIGATMIWFIIAGAIIIWQISQRRDS